MILAQLVQVPPVVVQAPNSETTEIAFRIAKEFGVPILILAVFVYLIVWKVFPGFLERDRQKDEERAVERKHQLDIFVGQIDALGKRNEDAFSQLKSSNDNVKSTNDSFKIAVDAFKESLQSQREQNKDIIGTIKDSHKTLTEEVAKSIKEDLSSIYRRIDELVKK